jgi:hypothetical protein
VVSIKGSERGDVCIAVLEAGSSVDDTIRRVSSYLKMLKRRWRDMYA